MQDTSKIKIASIILNWNNYELTRSCTASFGKIVAPGHEIIVVDNHSDNDSTRRIQREFPQYTYLYNSHNAGIAGGNNFGIKYALKKGAEFIFLCNNDIEILKEDSLRLMIEHLQEHPEIGILGTRLVYPDGKVQSSVKPFPTLWNQFYFDWFWFRSMRERLGMRRKVFDYDRTQDVEYVMGAAFLIRSRMIEEISLQDERFFLGYEDMDWCKTARDRGWKVRYFPEVTIKHVHGATSQGLLSTRNFDYYFGEKVRYFTKHYPFWYVFLFRLFSSIGAGLRALRGWARWLCRQEESRYGYARAYSRLWYRIWLFPWSKDAPPARPS